MSTTSVLPRCVCTPALFLVLGALCGSGCGTTKKSSEPPAGAAQPGIDWKADLARQRDLAEANVRLAKTAFATRPADLAEAQTLYTRVRTTMNLLIEDIQGAVREGRNPVASTFHASRAQEAEEALLRFNRHVEAKALPADKQPKFWPVAMPIVTGLGSLVWEKFQAMRARSAEQRKAAQERVASDLNSVRFVEFAEVSIKT